MSVRATGRLVDEQGAPWKQPRLTVEVRDESGLFHGDLGAVQADSEGTFAVSYPDDSDGLRDTFGRRRLGIQVRDRVGRLLHEGNRLDEDGETLNLGDLPIMRAEVHGYLVTLGTGEPVSLSIGNEVRPLIDNVDAWGHIAAAFKGAESSIEFTQLNFFTPAFAVDPDDEKPVLVFRFGEPELTTAAPRKVSAQDQRPEVVLREKAKLDNVSIRILLDHLANDFPFVTFAVSAFMKGRDPTQADEVQEYFLKAGADRVKTLPFLKSILRRMHLKVAFINGEEAISMASPFRPGYLDDPEHAIEDPRRGGAADTAFPLHDVSMSVKGPAVADAYDAFRLHWNAALPDEDATERAVPLERAAARTGQPDVIAALQVVRTFEANLFNERPAGELGILEGYLRAFAQAEQFIYCETQYLTNATIADALVKAVSDRPALRVIIALNINPDIVSYPRRQQRLINDLFMRLPADRPPQVGVFTRWRFERSRPPDRPRPRISPIWLHSKVAIVDDAWATVGSANLDGASLDRVVSHLFHSRHSELNFNVLNGVDGQPGTEVVKLLRRRLWSEHLGLQPDDPQLAPSSGEAAFDLWNVQAAAALQALQNPSTAPASSAYVLPYPVGAPLKCWCCPSHNEPREHLDAVNVGRDIDAIKSVRAFHYAVGDWDPKVPVQIDS